MSASNPPEIKPIDVDGVSAVVIGLVGWVIAEIVLLAVRLPADRHWWRWVPVAGFGFGLMGLTYVLRRRAAYRQVQGLPQTESNPNSSIKGSPIEPGEASATTSE